MKKKTNYELALAWQIKLVKRALRKAKGNTEQAIALYHEYAKKDRSGAKWRTVLIEHYLEEKISEITAKIAAEQRIEHAFGFDNGHEC